MPRSLTQLEGARNLGEKQGSHATAGLRPHPQSGPGDSVGEGGKGGRQLRYRKNDGGMRRMNPRQLTLVA